MAAAWAANSRRWRVMRSGGVVGHAPSQMVTASRIDVSGQRWSHGGVARNRTLAAFKPSAVILRRGAHREAEPGSSGLSCERTRSSGPDDLVGRAAATCTSRRLRLWSRGHTGTCKFLRPSTTLRLGRVDVTFTIGGNVMQRLEFSRGGAIAAKRIENLERLAIDHVYE